MAQHFVVPDPAAVKPDTPIRLEVAAALAFPDQSMTGKALRKEITNGRLKGWKMGGRIYTTLAAIEEMRGVAVLEPRPARPAPALPAATDQSSLEYARAVLRGGRARQ